jgi:multidrug efflux pump subunit AcrA (membrane-fusion protein)
MSEMISESGAVREPNEIAASDFSDAPAPALSTTDDPAMMAIPEVSMEEAEEILEDTGPILGDPESDAELDQLHVSLSSSLEQLNSVRQELLDAGHINRSEAAMLKNLTASAESISGFFQRMPVSSFTEMDSKVNYSATCESLGKSIVDTVINIIKTIFKYIVAIGKWFISFLTGRRRKDQLNDQADKAVEKKNQELDKKSAEDHLDDLRAQRVADRKVRVEAASKKLQPLYTRLVELLIDQPAAGPGDPLCRDELVGFANLSQSKEITQQIKEASGWSHQAVINVTHEQSYFINSYSTMAKAYPKLNSLPLKDLCNYPGLLTVLRTFKSYIQGLSTQKSNAEIDDPCLEVVRKFNQNTPHVRFNSLLGVIETNLKVNEDTLKAIEANTEKMKSATWVPDDFFPSRQRAAQQVKDKQLVLQELAQIQALLAAARDRSSQIALEYARARGDY